MEAVATEASTARPRTIAELIARQAEAMPAAAAVRCVDRAPLSYAGLHAAIAEIAAVLHGIGLGRGDRVAVVLPNGPEMALAFLGVAGAMVCAPLNPRYREDDFAFSFSDLGVKAVIARADHDAATAAARRLGLPLLALSPHADAPAGLFTLRAEPGGAGRADSAAPRRDDVALVLHTSGTTAKPKIVPLTHRNLCASADNVRRTLALAPADVCLNVMPLFHIHGLVGALLSTLAAGASIDCGTDPHGGPMLAHLQRSGATWYTAVPTIHQSFLEAIEDAPDAIAGHRLRLIRSSSAALPRRVMGELRARCGVPVIEAYGMTEASHQMASNPLGGAQKAGSVGLPAGPEIAVLGDAGIATGPGVVGEVVIRGETVTAGYDGNPQATAAAFVDGWFRTGDQGYFDDDGYLFLTGRLKELINRGGEKIAPREVEDALLRHPAVAQAVAFAVPHRRLGEEVGAAVVLKPGATATADDLRRTAQRELAYFKIPKAIQIVESIPTGATGKLQRSGLAEALGLGEKPATVGRAPETAIERQLAGEWKRLLRVEAVGVDDDFFALGGDSLAATELMMLAGAMLEAEIPFGEFLERPTIAALIELADRARRSGAGAAELVALQTGGEGRPLFCPAAADNSLWWATRLLRHLGREHTVYGLRTPSPAARGTPPGIEEIASHGVASLLRVQPHGPHRLVGARFGAVVAFAMARQLERDGHRVGLLALIDCVDRRPAALGASWHDRAFAALAALGLPRPAALRQPMIANRWAEARYRGGPLRADVLLAHAALPPGGTVSGRVTRLDYGGAPDRLWSDDAFLSQLADTIRRHDA